MQPNKLTVCSFIFAHTKLFSVGVKFILKIFICDFKSFNFWGRHDNDFGSIVGTSGFSSASAEYSFVVHAENDMAT